MELGRIGYLVSQYPAVNHTFILREILGLRALGWDVRVVSIRPADRPMEKLSEIEAAECRRTQTLLADGWGSLATSAAKEMLARPVGALDALVMTFTLAGWDARKWTPAIAYWLEALAAGAYFQRLGIAHVHTHFASTVLVLAARAYKFTYSMTIHGPDEFNDVAGFGMAVKVAGATGVVTISNYGASQTMRASAPVDWGKVTPVRLGVDPVAYAPVEGRGRELRNLLMVGRLAPAKAQLLLVEAAAILRKRGWDQLHWKIVGEGPDRGVLEERIAALDLKQTVELTGALHHGQVKEIYGQADLFVMASFAEGVPVVLMEAMAMEIPCIATWVMGIPELIRDGETGLLVPPADSGAIADAVERLCIDTELRARLGKAGRNKIESDYNLVSNVGKLSALFSHWTERR